MPDLAAPLKLGADCFGQNTTWSEYLTAMQLADRLGYDSLWTPDHVLPTSGDLTGPILEPYMSLAAVAASTSQATLGLLVSPVSLRHPTLMAKMVTTLDHISEGRAILGVGAGWAASEHLQYGLDFGASQGERLRWLEEALPVLRGMLDGERPSSNGPRYDVQEAINEPRPVQRHLPLLVGGGGPTVTPRLVATFADANNLIGDPAFVAERDAALVAHCEDLGRDEREIERTVALRWPIVRDSRAEAERVRRAMMEHQGLDPSLLAELAGTPEDLFELTAAYAEIGYRHIIAGLLAPYDEETMTRIIAEVRPRLEVMLTT